MKFVLLSLIVLLSPFCLQSQNEKSSKVIFDTESFDFGNLKVGATATHIFSFTNTGSKPVRLIKVTASCGCTTPQWDSLPVLPGKRGQITVVFHCFPIEKTFSKTISVESSADPSLNLLEIKGNCMDPYKAQKAKYTVSSGRLNFETTHIDFDKVYSNVTLTQMLFYYYNNSEDTIKVNGFITPAHILCAASPDLILPHAEGTIIVNYNANLNTNFGFNFDKIKMLTNDRELAEKTLAVSSDLREYFDTSIVNNARITLKETSHEFGKVKPGEIKIHVFEIKNTGTDTLIIRKVRPACGCTEVQLGYDKILPGKTTSLKVTYNTAGAIKGVNNKLITLISTDKQKPELNIGVSVIVE